MTELSFHGIDTPAKKAGSVTHVSGTERHLCLGPFILVPFESFRESNFCRNGSAMICVRELRRDDSFATIRSRRCACASDRKRSPGDVMRRILPG
jgi:hypothetical protein